MTAISQSIQIKNTVPIEYKGYTIQPDYSGYRWRFMFYKTEEGVQHDHDYIDGTFIYMGNCRYASSMKGAKDLIDEIVPFFVETYTRKYGSGLNITKFDYLSEAVEFAVKFNGTMNVSFNSI